LGTLGGPNSFIPNPLTGAELTNASGVVGESDTLIPDPYAPNCLQSTCLVNHAFSWQKGVLTDLGALPGINSSIPFATNSRSQTVGGSENSIIDPLTGFPEFRAVLWQHGEAIDLGTFGGNNAVAISINNRGQVVGGALNTTPDSFGFCLQPFTIFFPTQVHAFIWQNGAMRDLGTLGGNDSCALLVNEKGQAAGFSYTDSTPNPTTGVPTLDPFIWQNGAIVDLGTLGGVFGVPNWLNNRGQVVGTSDLAGDVNFHGFLWDRGALQDIGTLGGDTSEAFWVNDAGDVVGRADVLGSQSHHAFLWKNGAKNDLGTVGDFPCSTALAINSAEQTVGDTGICGTGGGPPFLSEHGQPMVDLSKLVLPGSDITLTDAFTINDRGEIGGTGVLPNGDEHAVLLIPASPEEIAAANAPGRYQSTSASVRVRIRNSENSVSGGRRKALNMFRQTRRLQ
jgi:probable HAF family extracellular repeat protein